MDSSPLDLTVQPAHTATSTQVQEHTATSTQVQEHPTTTTPDQHLLAQQRQPSLSNLELPTDHPRLLTQSPTYANYTFVVSQDVRAAVLELERAEGFTLYEILLAAFQVLLHRYTNQDELLLGVSSDEHTRIELRNEGENPANISLLHTDISGNPSFRALLARIHDALWETTDTHAVPLKNRMAIDLRELTLTVQEHEQELRGCIEYQADLFEEGTIARMVGHWHMLLSGAAAVPAQSLSDLPLLTKGEQQQILEEWNDTTVDYPRNRCIHQLFEAQVEQTPAATAVISVEGSLTYRALNQRANQLAHYLQQRGVGPETLVGICVERSLEMVVGILGILKAGGAYVPLDPAYPQDRLAFMLSDSRASLLLTQERLLPVVPVHDGVVICLDRDWGMISRESDENLESGSTAENMAYIIYTSGSTGKPKGVVIEHRSLVNYALAACDAFAMSHEDRVLQFAPLSFDTSSEEIYPCLIKGATLVLRSASMIDSISEFLQKCREWELTVLDLPTAFWHELTRKVGADAIALPQSLRLIIVGGERALPEMLALWQASGNRHIKLMNTYGPTEGTIVATIHEMLQSTTEGSMLREVPIGRPVANVQVYLLDPHLNAVPIGIPGELHIGGAGLAREYLNRPELTDEKFIVNPFHSSSAARLYKTGDRARYLPTGEIEFLGRLDQQVKVRGFRIELGEIEATLCRHPKVDEAIVMARDDASGVKRLVAYVVPQHGHAASSKELHSFMKDELPDYMVPSAIVLLESLPLTPSGKIDRLALPAPEESRPEVEYARVAPTTPEQQQLIEVWEELLQVRPIGIKDNFFELGGHSLLAVRLVDRIEQLWGKKVTPKMLLDNATVEELVAALFQQKNNAVAEIATPSKNGAGHDAGKGQPSGVKSIWGRLTGKKK
jgi:amino acid adenylation domain-containing protein